MKQKTKKEKIYPFAVSKINNKTVFFCYVQNNQGEGLLLCERVGLRYKKIDGLTVFSEDGEVEDLQRCENFHIFKSGEHWYLIYSRIYTRLFKKKIQTVISKSNDAVHFNVIDRENDKTYNALAVISGHRHKDKFLVYFGGESITVAVSSDLKNWHASGKLLSPRKDHFDSGPLHVVDALTTKRGILIIYESKVYGKSKSKIIGGALFSLDQPYKMIWRSEDALWKKALNEEMHPLRYLGCIIEKDTLHTYWASRSNKIVLQKINTVISGIGSMKKRPVHLERYQDNPIIKASTTNKWEHDSTFNPAAINLDNKVHLLYRAIGINGVSVFGYASSTDGFSIYERMHEPAFAAMDFSLYSKDDQALHPSKYVSGGSWIGCEDPRMTQIDDRVYMTYTSFDGYNPPGVALTWIGVQDFLCKNWNWKRPILISKPGEIQKNWMLFPEKINGKFAILHSITPHISIEYVDDLEKEGLVIESQKKPGKDEYRWDNIVRGAGAPPIKTEYGWLLLYHAMNKNDTSRYKVGAMILDYSDPTKILYRASCPILEPNASYENEGAKSGVVYVCGTVIKDGKLFVYYGGADSVVCVATADVDEFLKDMIEGSVVEKIKQKKQTKKIAKR